MTPEQFVYWLRGFVEISGSKELTKEQMQIVQDHLDLVLTKVTPQRDPRDNRRCEKTPLKPGEPINHAWPIKLCDSGTVRPQRVLGLETYC